MTLGPFFQTLMVSIELTPAVPEILRRGNRLKYEVSTLLGHLKLKPTGGGGPTTTTTGTGITNNLAKRVVTTGLAQNAPRPKLLSTHHLNTKNLFGTAGEGVWGC